MKNSLKALFPFIVQFLILSLSFVLINKLSTLPTTALFVIRYLSYIILVIGGILSIWFNRGRVFFSSLFLIACQFLIINYKIFAISENDFSKFLYPIMGMLIPINLILFSQLKERGIFSFWGKLKILFIVAEMFFIYQIVVSNNSFAMSLISYKIPIVALQKTFVNPIVIIMYGLSIIFLIVKVIINKTSYEKRMIGVLVFTFIALYYVHNRLMFSIFLADAGFIFIIGVIEDSYLMAYMDELTGIPSRRALREMLMKLGSKYTIAMIDIDFFKKFNDKYGHDVGDDVLKLVASNLETITGGGKAFRYGGEEFTIVFPGKTITEVIPHLEKLREQVSKAAYTKKSDTGSKSKSKRSTSKQLFVTISIGVSEKTSKNKKPNEVMKSADKALYRAKKKGRNCVSK